MGAHTKYADDRCFPALAARPPVRFAHPPTLTDAESAGLADLLALLGCGEEAAAIAFHRLAERGKFAPGTQAALRLISDEEQVHDAWLTGLASKLPPPTLLSETQAAARRFHARLGRGTPAEHLARIAAIDAAVCMILSRLIAPRTALRADRAVTQLISRIRHDESRHVAVARNVVIESGMATQLRDTAAHARWSLGQLIAPFGSAFETLGVDPDRLAGNIAHMPNGLL